MTTRKTVIAGVALILATFGFAGCVSRSPERADPRVGRPAPPFELSDLGGSKVSLKSLEGKVVMLDFWATWCGPCRVSMPLLENLSKEYPNDLALLAINLEEPRDLVRQYVEKQKLRSIILLDSDGKVGSAYRTESIPMQVLIDKNGVVRHVQIGLTDDMKEELKRQIDKLL